MAAIRATHCKIGTVLESGRPHKHVCLWCRSIRTVERSRQKKEVQNRGGHSGPKTAREKVRVDQAKVGVAAVETDGQTIAHWDKLRDTVSGLKASVGSISLSWKSENGKGEKSSDMQNGNQKDRNIKTEEEVVNETIKPNETHGKTENKEYLYMNKEGETLSSELNAKWVEQILEIHEERSKEITELDNISNVKTMNKSPMSKEKLDDPLAETNTEAAKRKNEPTASTGLASRITFSYFSKANKMKNASTQVLEQNVQQKPKDDTKGEQKSSSASTIDWIKDAVGFSATQKDISNSSSADDDNLDTVKATIADTNSSRAAPKNTNGTDADKSYWNVLSYLQQNVPLTSATKPVAETPEQIARNIMHSELESESTFSVRTSSLSDNLVSAQSNMSKMKRLEDFCMHLTQHPQFRHIAVEHKVLPCLLKLRECGNPKIMAKANEALALVGYITPPQGRGIRMLSIDGGGTRGLIAIEILQRLERLCNQPVNQMFDFVIGSSTGALLAALIFLLKIPLPECKELYLDRSAKMFVKESLLKKTRNMALHDVSIFEEVLKAECGEDTLMSSARDPSTPKMAITSTLVNVPKWKTFMFRNYNHPPGVISDYQGSCNLKMWEAIRASGSAPVYYSPFQIGEHIFRDGGCLINNPTAAGIHECKLLWPHESFQCVLSLGNGRYDPNLDRQEKAKGYNVIPRSMRDLADGFIDSATDTEGIHMVLKNTLDPACYFRLSPYLRENYDLSEVQPEKIKVMLGEADEYMDRNELFMQKVVTRLKQDRLPNQKIMDYTNRRRQTHDYILFNLNSLRTVRKTV
ncbi:calcium-independent phospholipase A2-gamma-like [Mercenaria mercenaria]|uniref:calcium-independent phospholipase A2-gamma-like n=1 Tax=Mercenaria mercenaria TaxID=6596 RepID=UPI00234EF737|nr:calcium-independent phospholipase A2-gamma-like [Mercenaria mercenaria]